MNNGLPTILLLVGLASTVAGITFDIAGTYKIVTVGYVTSSTADCSTATPYGRNVAFSFTTDESGVITRFAFLGNPAGGDTERVFKSITGELKHEDEGTATEHVTLKFNRGSLKRSRVLTEADAAT